MLNQTTNTPATASTTGKTYLGNAFSLNMLKSINLMAIIRVIPVKPEEVPIDAESVIGHADTARVVGNMLGREVPANRASVTLGENDVLYVAQYQGPRLQEGATQLPEGATLSFYKVEAREGCYHCQAEAGDCNYCSGRSFILGW